MAKCFVRSIAAVGATFHNIRGVWIRRSDACVEVVNCISRYKRVSCTLVSHLLTTASDWTKMEAEQTTGRIWQCPRKTGQVVFPVFSSVAGKLALFGFCFLRCVAQIVNGSPVASPSRKPELPENGRARLLASRIISTVSLCLTLIFYFLGLTLNCINSFDKTGYKMHNPDKRNVLPGVLQRWGLPFTIQEG